MDRIFLVPIDNIIELLWQSNLTKKSDLVGRLQYKLLAILVAEYFWGMQNRINISLPE